jgi:hypothetical protein
MILKLRIDKIDPLRFKQKDPLSGYWEAIAHIAVASFSKLDGIDDLLLSADCRGPSEVIYWADKMIKELERIKVRAAKMKWNSSHNKSK